MIIINDDVLEGSVMTSEIAHKKMLPFPSLPSLPPHFQINFSFQDFRVKNAFSPFIVHRSNIAATSINTNKSTEHLTTKTIGQI